LIAEVFGKGQRQIGRVAAHQGRLVGGRDHHHGPLQPFLAEVVLQELLHLAATLADKTDHGHVGSREAGHHRQKHRLADPRSGEDAHALAAARGQEGVDGADAEVERFGDAAPGMRRRRVGAEGMQRRARLQRPFAVDRLAEGVDHAAEPRRRGPHPVEARADVRRAAAAHTPQAAERHGEGSVARETDHLAGHHAAVDLDVDAPAEMHGRHRAGDLDEEPAHRRDAAEHLQIVDRLERCCCSGDAAFSFVLRLHRPSTFHLPVSLTLASSRLQPASGA
jgi:hypothetical protein